MVSAIISGSYDLGVTMVNAVNAVRILPMLID
jgi:hypothetical protein